jgi:RHH-type rel operon transcriptional repressor/antitoxin RelB
MLGVRLDKETEERLARLARETHRSKSYYVKEALVEYLAEKEEALLALARLEKGQRPLSTEELWASLGWSRPDEAPPVDEAERTKKKGRR